MFGKHMTNEEKLDAIYKMTLENHEVLRTIRRGQFVGSFIRIIYWLVVLGVIGGIYYYIKPMITTLGEKSANIETTLRGLGQLKANMPDASAINKILGGAKEGQ